jgi:aminopeptidase N
MYRIKAMFVWWMLRDMVGDAALQRALKQYRPADDKSPSYLPDLIAREAHRDLSWFFDEWVYRDRGLPDFRLVSAFPRPTLANAYVVAVTVENLGAVSAEVPVIVRTAQGDRVKRVLVKAHDKTIERIEVPVVPTEVIVNDGSVPESDTTNNSFVIPKEPKR